MNHYALQWLDLLSQVRFDTTQGHTINEEQLKRLFVKVTEETERIKLTILDRTFSLKKERTITTLIRQYHSALLSLYDQTSQSLTGSTNGYLRNFYQALQTAHYELLLFIELRFTSHLNKGQVVPGSYYLAVCKSLGARVASLRVKLRKQLSDKHLFDAIFRVLDNFDSPGNPGERHSITSYLYKRELLSELEFVCDKDQGDNDLEQNLRDVLVFYNFNAPDFTTYLVARKEAIVASLPGYEDKINFLKEREDRLLTIGRKQDYKLIENLGSIEDSLTTWFRRKREELGGNAVEGGVRTGIKRTGFGNMFKIACSLSVDQIAILLFAAFDTGIFIARSLSEIFKGIAPFISSKQKKDISWDSMRSKIYSVEKRDKDTVIQVLKDMIARIEEI